MKLESVGILIELRPFGERDCVATVFTRDFGIMHGMMKGRAVARKNKPLVGQVGNVSWNARLDSQLGVFHWERSRNLIAPLMSDASALRYASAAFSLLSVLLPEREKYETLFDETLEMLGKFCPSAREGLKDRAREGLSHNEIYIEWEMTLLRELGYALDLSRCSGCGCVENLNFLSPKTGRAVCDTCAAPYIGRLYELPLSVGTTKKFISKICDQMNIKLPMRRDLI